MCVLYSYPWTVSPTSREQGLCFTYFITGTGPSTDHSADTQYQPHVLSTHRGLCTAQHGSDGWMDERVGGWVGGWEAGEVGGWINGEWMNG